MGDGLGIGWQIESKCCKSAFRKSDTNRHGKLTKILHDYSYPKVLPNLSLSLYLSEADSQTYL